MDIKEVDSVTILEMVSDTLKDLAGIKEGNDEYRDKEEM